MLGLDIGTCVGGVDKLLRLEARRSEIRREVETAELGLKIGEAGDGSLGVRESEQRRLLEVSG